MKINNQYNRYNDIGRRGINNNKASNPFNSALFAHNKNLTFKGFDIPGFLSKIDTPPRSITYTNIDKVTDAIDGIIGKDGYFAAQLEKAGISTKDNIITVDKHTLGGDLISTLKYPIVDMPFDILKAICNGLKKTPLRAVGDAILNIGFIQQKIQKMETQRSYETVLKILNQYCPEGGGPISKLNDAFSQVTADKITKTAKNYDSRDERTINRIVTGGVGVVLSAQDAYNISMLEKNDKEDAKEAEKDRLIQEASRVGISAGLTFLTLGALERYTKGSVFLSALLVAGSTLFAEIASRVFKHKPLIPITPEAAAKIAQKRKPNKPAQPASVVETTRQRMDKQDKNNLFSEFTHSAHITTTGQPADAQPAAQIQQNTQKPAKPSQKQAKAKKRKKIAIIATLLTAFAAASAYYVVSRYAKGDYLAKAARKELLEKNSDRIKAYLADAYAENLDADILKEIDRIKKLKPQNKHLTIFNVLASLKDKITKKSIEVDVEKLEDEINNLLATEGTDDIAPVLGIYKNHIGILKEKNIYKYNDQKVKNIVPNALYDGFGKIFRTLYTALSIPGFIIDSFINKKYKASEEIFKQVEKKLSFSESTRLQNKCKKELAELMALFNEHKNQRNEYQKIAKLIKTHTRNFSESPETGELAHVARTLVTLISSWFYINDYRNMVLIESEGKNVQRAREVRNESIGFKLANFVFNGTLMNLFNSVFKDFLNGSLVGAAVVPFVTEICNEILVRGTIGRPFWKKESKDDIIKYEHKITTRKGILGAWTRFFKKITGQKSLMEKAGVSANQQKK